MLTKLLLPHKYKRIGWIILIPVSVLGVLLMVTDIALPLKTKVFAVYADELLGESHVFDFITVNITNTLLCALFVIGALLVGFSKEKEEDEFIAGLRLSSLLWAVLLNYILLFLAILFIYGLAFLNILLFNIFTILIIFIARFNYVLYRSKSLSDEKHH